MCRCSSEIRATFIADVHRFKIMLDCAVDRAYFAEFRRLRPASASWSRPSTAPPNGDFAACRASERLRICRLRGPGGCGQSRELAAHDRSQRRESSGRLRPTFRAQGLRPLVLHESHSCVARVELALKPRAPRRVSSCAGAQGRPRAGFSGRKTRLAFNPVNPCGDPAVTSRCGLNGDGNWCR